MISIRRLLPADTRPIELISGASLLISALLIISTGELFFPKHLHDFHQWQFWGILSGIFGVVQLYAVAMDDLESLRAVTAWFTGVYWVWTGLVQLFGPHAQFDDVVIVLLGASCLYAFIINLLFTAKRKWN